MQWRQVGRRLLVLWNLKLAPLLAWHLWVSWVMCRLWLRFVDKEPKGRKEIKKSKQILLVLAAAWRLCHGHGDLRGLCTSVPARRCPCAGSRGRPAAKAPGACALLYTLREWHHATGSDALRSLRLLSCDSCQRAPGASVARSSADHAPSPPCRPCRQRQVCSAWGPLEPAGVEPPRRRLLLRG